MAVRPGSRRPVRLVAITALLLAAGRARAQDVAWGGRVEVNLRAGTTGCTLLTPGDCPWLDFGDAAVAAGWLQASAPGVSARAAGDLRLHPGTAASDLVDVSDPDLVRPWSFKLEDAWVRFDRGAVQLQLGAQKVRWGVADGVRPADVVNPYDLEDPTRFDRRLAVPMARGRVSLARQALELVVVPWFTPALVHPDLVDLDGDGQDYLEALSAEGVQVGVFESRPEVPPASLSEVAVGGRWSWASPVGDLAVSAYRGRDSLPQVDGELVITGFATDGDRVDLGVPIAWPRLVQVAGSWRGELGWDVAGWVEAALVFPEATEVVFSRGQLENLVELGTLEEVPDPLPTVVTQDGEPYARWIAGVERFFGPVYANLQWLHGFPTERQRSDLRDYGLLALRWSPGGPWAVRLGVVTDLQGVLGTAGLDLLVADLAEGWLEAAQVAAPDGAALAAFAAASHVGVGSRLRF